MNLPILFAQLVVTALLFACLYAGYRRWIVPHHFSPKARGLMLLVILTLTGGYLGSYFWAWDIEASFAWDLLPLASRLLAAAALAFGIASTMALEKPTFRRMRLVLIMLAIYLTPLLIMIPLTHLDRFDPDAPITYAFFIVVIGMTLPALYFLWQQPATLPNQAEDQIPPSLLTRSWLILVAVITGLWGIALFITDEGGSALIWLWAGDLLTTRLIAVMLLTLAVGAATSYRYLSTSRMMLAVMITYGLGGALAAFWNTLDDKPIKYSYLITLLVIGIISLGLFLREKPVKV